MAPEEAPQTEVPSPQDDMPMEPQEEAPVDTTDEMGPDEMGGVDIPEEPVSDEDENSDKKEIQKKTGELSQLLNTYPEEDEELQKYVKGMVDAALDKMGGADGEEDVPEEPIDDAQEEMPMESVRFTKGQLKKINEIFAKNHDEENLNSKKQNKISKKNPFNAPKFK